MANNNSNSNDKVLITGGSGFIAQHLLRHLNQNYSQRIQSIFLVDKLPFSNWLDIPPNIPTHFEQLDLAGENRKDPDGRLGTILSKNGITTVFHLASSPFPLFIGRNPPTVHDNWFSTTAVLNACVETGVRNFVFLGDAMSHMAWNDVCTANDINFVSIRVGFVYGEGDSTIVPAILSLAYQNHGIFTAIKEAQPLQFTYAGNVGALLALAWEKLIGNPSTVSGQVFFCNEGNEASVWSLNDYIRPFLNDQGYVMDRNQRNYEITYAKVWLLEKLHDFFGVDVSSLTSTPLIPRVSVLEIFVATAYVYCSTKARLLLDWVPPYDPTDSMIQTRKWWVKQGQLLQDYNNNQQQLQQPPLTPVVKNLDDNSKPMLS